MSRRAGVTALTTAVLLFSQPLPASAEPTPAPSPTSGASSSASTPAATPTATPSLTPDGSGRIEDVLARQQQLTVELQAAQARLDAAEAEAGLAAEAYNKARTEQQAAAKALAAAKKAAADAKAASTKATSRVNQLAATLYMAGPDLSGLKFLLGSESPDQLIRRAAGLEAVADYRDRSADQAAVAATKAAQAQSAAARAELKARQATAAADRARQKAQAAADAMEAEATAIQTQQNTLLTELASLRKTSVEAEVERLILAGESAARARVLAEKTFDGGNLPAPDSRGAATAIEFAKAQLGKPYLWGGEGPESWDCSGLTQAAWGASGKRLTHYTGNQWQETKRVAIADLAPGDLVFFGKNPDSIHHVGLYVGNGMMIEAPRTGLNVRYASIYRSSLMTYGGRIG
ncbi:MAG: NlpC/P60 family protein [Dermatophilus congolensis]|nr:NlpC/P60 family protein [Dermatophilus congolensis]